MRTFRVTFAWPVVYLSDSKRRREVTELLVHAPSEDAARTHALRVTTGDPGAVSVAEADIWALQNESLKVRRA